MEQAKLDDSMRYLYADTSVWNGLCDQEADPRALSLALANSGVTFALGFNALFEMAKLFFSNSEKAPRGRGLLDYMKGYLAIRIPIVKENWALLVEEALDANREKRMESCFRDAGQYQQTFREVDKLLAGDVEPEAAQFFQSRKAAARTSRSSIREHLEARADLTAALRAVREDALPDFLRMASLGRAGQHVLQNHLCQEFPRNLPGDLAGVARILLRSSRYRASHAMTRSDLYLNWRCANRGSIRSDLPDDTFHVVSAAYCHVFVTMEADQADVARHAIEGIQSIVCNHGDSISDRLVSGLGGSAD